MDGAAIASRPLAEAGLGTLTGRFPPPRPERIRLDAALAILGEAAAARAWGEPAGSTAPGETMRATRP